ncbi:MAG: dNTP triphosphohydrolase [Candidatus Paceibacterota bacterium]
MDWNKLLSDKRLRPSSKDYTGDARNPFESDFGRLIFSPATRRMHDKTQVFPLTSDDNIHSRLTHSLEVLAIGYSLGIRIVENDEFLKRTNQDKDYLIRSIPTTLKNVCLVHDIGNPPFGHFGETVISQYFSNLFSEEEEKKVYGFELSKDEKRDFTSFDGNAQGFRVLTKLQILQDRYGLNLTCNTLASFLKYPNFGKPISDRFYTEKIGVFQSEKEAFKEVASECGLEISGKYLRHPLAYLMEAADSICYYVMDIEDGYNKGLYNYDFIKEYLLDEIKDEEVIESLFKKSDEVNGINERNAKIIKLRISLIDYLVDLAVENFIMNIESIEKGTYKSELIEEDSNNVANTLYSFCKEHIFKRREIEFLELTGHAVISGLLDYYIQFLFNGSKHYKRRALNLISKSIKLSAFLDNGIKNNSILKEDELKCFEKLDDYYKLRIIVDFITGMTDQFALKHYQKLSGQKII